MRIAILLPHNKYTQFLLYSLVFENEICFINFSLWSKLIDYQIQTFWADKIISANKLEKKLWLDLWKNNQNILRIDSIKWLIYMFFHTIKGYIKIYFKINKNNLLYKSLFVFTSWSSWLPKLAQLNLWKIKENIEWRLKQIYFKRNHNILCILPYFHSFWINTWLVFPLLQKLWYIQTQLHFFFNYKITNIYEIAKDIKKKKIHYIPITPYFLSLLLEFSENKTLDSLKSVFVWWDFSSQALITKFHTIVPHGLYHKWYWLTECFPIISGNCSNDIQNENDWKILSHIRYKLLQEDWSIKNSGEWILLIHINNTIWNYEDWPLDTIVIWWSSYFNTRDYVSIDKLWNLKVLTREKRIIKKWWEMINLDFLQSIINDSFLWVCIGKQESIYFFSKQSIDIVQLNKYILSCWLSSLYKIKQTIHIDTIPMISIGKIDYKILENYI